MCKRLRDKRGEMNPLFIRIIIGVVCVLILISVGISALLDSQSDKEYQLWAREENQKVFDDSQQTRITERQLLKLKRELNDSFYQRLEHDLSVRVLIVGDAYGNGFGASNKSAVWSRLLQAGLKKKFGVKVEIENITLSGMNGGYSTWARLMALPDGTAGEVLSAAGAVKNKEGAYTGELLSSADDVKNNNGSDTSEDVDAKTVTASRQNEYDLCIVSLGMTDEPGMFELYYEGVLREVHRKYEKCSIISLLSNQALTAPELGYADDNYDALYRISKRYGASVINVGLEMTDPDAAAKGATMSQLPYGSATSQILAADMRSDGISEKKVNEISAKDLKDRTAAAEKAIEKYTIGGLYLNNEGQKFLSDRIVHFIEKKVSKSAAYKADEPAPLRKEVRTLDQYHYFPVSKLVRLDDFTYVLAENQVSNATGALSAAGNANNVEMPVNTSENKKPFTGTIGSIVGVDYDLVPGDNDLYAATGDGTVGFGRITQHYDGDGKERFIQPLNDGYSVDSDGNILLAFSTKEQADTLRGVIIGGDFALPSYFDGYQRVPYIGLTDSDGKPVDLDKDGKPLGEGDDKPVSPDKDGKPLGESGIKGTSATKNDEGSRQNEASGRNEASKAIDTSDTSSENTIETTAATFGNDQTAYGNAAAVSESISNLMSEGAIEAEVITLADETREEFSQDGEGQEETTQDDGPSVPDETEWSSYEIGNH